jgi:hypothetical protein
MPPEADVTRESELSHFERQALLGNVILRCPPQLSAQQVESDCKCQPSEIVIGQEGR